MLVTSDIPVGQNLSDNANINISNLNAADILVDAGDRGVIDSGDELLFRFTQSVENSTGASRFQSDLGLSANYSWNENYDRLTATLTGDPQLSSDGSLLIDPITVNFADGSTDDLKFTFDIA